MSEALQTLEGWYALHDFRSLHWPTWKQCPKEEQEEAIHQFFELVSHWRQVEANKLGSTALYCIIGQKADLLIIHLRETLAELHALETQFNKTKFADYCDPAYSYVSVVELSNYMSRPGTDPLENPDIVARLKPTMQKAEHICFYPMNKTRADQYNWYMLSLEERRQLMRTHSLIGRSYAGKVKQMITGSIGFDDWEWGVTLFADDALQFKKLVYEMRFDEVSARYGEFGPFFVGHLLDEESFKSRLL